MQVLFKLDYYWISVCAWYLMEVIICGYCGIDDQSSYMYLSCINFTPRRHLNLYQAQMRAAFKVSIFYIILNFQHTCQFTFLVIINFWCCHLVILSCYYISGKDISTSGWSKFTFWSVRLGIWQVFQANWMFMSDFTFHANNWWRFQSKWIIR